jgi:hypothetical protein
MKAYGFRRADKLQCKFGCCTRWKGNKYSSCRKISKRRARKAARLLHKYMIKELVSEEV